MPQNLQIQYSEKLLIVSIYKILFLRVEELEEKLPEVGDLDKPKIVFFFDEAHLLFNKAPKQLLDRIEHTVKLIRSKGVGIFFITQNPADIPDAVLAQLSTRIQHALRAYTPNEIKAVKMAADSFRINPEFDTAEMITELKTGQALVSALQLDGSPSVVEKTKVLPPKSKMGIIGADKVQRSIESDSIYGKYERSHDPQSAYEDLEDIVGLYLQKEEGYLIFPSTNKIGTKDYEYMLVQKSEPYKKAIIQCKNNSCISEDNWKKFEEGEYDDKIVYILTIKEDPHTKEKYTKCSETEIFEWSYNGRILVFNSEKLKKWAKDNKLILPERIKKYLEMSE